MPSLDFHRGWVHKERPLCLLFTERRTKNVPLSLLHFYNQSILFSHICITNEEYSVRRMSVSINQNYVIVFQKNKLKIGMKQIKNLYLEVNFGAIVDVERILYGTLQAMGSHSSIWKKTKHFI